MRVRQRWSCAKTPRRTGRLRPARTTRRTRGPRCEPARDDGPTGHRGAGPAPRTDRSAHHHPPVGPTRTRPARGPTRAAGRAPTTGPPTREDRRERRGQQRRQLRGPRDPRCRRHHLRDLQAERGGGVGAPPLQPQGAPREPVADRGRPGHHRGVHPGLAGWDPIAEPDTEIQYVPGRVVMQDFTGVPCFVDFATMREAVAEPAATPPASTARARRSVHRPLRRRRPFRHPVFEKNVERDYQRNEERSSSCAGPRRRSTSSMLSCLAPASSTRSTSSTWPAW